MYQLHILQYNEKNLWLDQIIHTIIQKMISIVEMHCKQMQVFLEAYI